MLTTPSLLMLLHHIGFRRLCLDSVTDVCMEVGFSSLGSFSTLFLTRVGESPSAYRRRARAVCTVPRLSRLELFSGCLTLLARLPPSAHSIFREAPRLWDPAHSR